MLDSIIKYERLVKHGKFTEARLTLITDELKDKCRKVKEMKKKKFKPKE